MRETQNGVARLWLALPLSLRAIISGILIAMVAANVWLFLLRSIQLPLAAIIGAAFLGLYLW